MEAAHCTRQDQDHPYGKNAKSKMAVQRSTDSCEKRREESKQKRSEMKTCTS